MVQVQIINTLPVNPDSSAMGSYLLRMDMAIVDVFAGATLPVR